MTAINRLQASRNIALRERVYHSPKSQTTQQTKRVASQKFSPKSQPKAPSIQVATERFKQIIDTESFNTFTNLFQTTVLPQTQQQTTKEEMLNQLAEDRTDLTDYFNIVDSLYEGTPKGHPNKAEPLLTKLISINMAMTVFINQSGDFNSSSTQEKLAQYVQDFNEKKAQLRQEIVAHCEFLQSHADELKGSAKEVSKKVVGLLKQAQNDTSLKTHLIFECFQPLIEKQNKKFHKNAALLMNKEDRKATYIALSQLKSWVAHASPESFCDKRISQKRSSINLSPRRHSVEINQLKCTDYLNKVSEYFNHFHFSDDEIEEFQKFTSAGHLPTRQNLVDFSGDMIKGGELALRNEVLNYFLDPEKFPEEKWPKTENNLKDVFVKLKEEPSLNNQEFIDYLKELQTHMEGQAEGKLIESYLEFQGFLSTYNQNFERHSAIGNNNVTEQLPLNKDELKKVKEEATEVYQEIFRKLANIQLFMKEHTQKELVDKRQKALTDLQNKLYKLQNQEPKPSWVKLLENEPSMENLPPGRAAYLLKTLKQNNKKIHSSTAKKALESIAKIDKQIENDLNEAREAVISHTSRWDVPIQRTYSPGKGLDDVTYTMECPNEGRASSAFRGRESGILPNFWRSTLSNSKGKQLFGRFGHTSSSTPTEFFQLDDEKRKKATREQCMEVLSEKVMNRMTDKDEKDKLKKSTKEEPYVLHTSGVSLMTLDTIREWLMAEKALNQAVCKKLGHNVDPSQLERRQYKEAHEAIMSFDLENTKASQEIEFTFTDGQGSIRKVEIVDSDKKVFKITTTQKNGRPQVVHVQFSIAYYNTGVNKWTKHMNSSRETQAYWGTRALSGLSKLPGASLILKQFAKSKSKSSVTEFAKNTLEFQNEQIEERIQQCQDKIIALFGEKKISETHKATLRQQVAAFIENNALPTSEEHIGGYSQTQTEIINSKLLPQIQNEIKQAQKDVKKIKKTIIRPHKGDDGMVEGNFLEDQNNQIAFHKQTKHIEAKLDELNQQRVNISVSQDLLNCEKKLNQARAKFIHYERQLKSSDAPSALFQGDLKKVRNQAFREWKAARQELAEILKNKEEYAIIRLQHDIQDLRDQVSDQLEFKDHRKNKYMDRNMYTFSATLACLGILLDEDPHTHCRSGKDRTSLQRIQIQTQFLMREKLGYFPNYRDTSHANLESKLCKAATLHSGQIDELARKNIGAEGLNTGGVHTPAAPVLSKKGKAAKDFELELAIKGSYAFFMRRISLAH